MTKVQRVAISHDGVIESDIETVWRLLVDDWANQDWWENKLERDGMKAGRTYLEGDNNKIPRTKVIERSNADPAGLPIVNRETLLLADEVAHRLYYDASNGFLLGARNYIATWAFDALPDGRCRMHISSNFDVVEPGNGNEVRDTLKGVYELIITGIDNFLKKRRA